MNDIVYTGKHLITYSVLPHSHDSWELIYCTSGSGEIVFESGAEPLKYQTGDLVVIPPGLVHSNFGEKGFTNIHLNITDCALTFRTPVAVADDADGHILNACRDAFYFHHSDQAMRDILLSALGNLLINYVIAFQEARGFSRAVETILSSIVQNFQDCGYELDGFLRSLPFNYDYLRKLFRSETGLTPRAFLEKLRLENACEFLRNMDGDHDSVAKIAANCGYADPLYFSRVFKKHYGISPLGYARANRVS